MKYKMKKIKKSEKKLTIKERMNLPLVDTFFPPTTKSEDKKKIT